MGKTTRRFGLLDAMILVAAIAIGLAWARFQRSIPGHLYNPFDSSIAGFGEPVGPPSLVFLDKIWDKFVTPAPIMATLAVGLVIVRFRPPGPGFRRGLLQPGASACMATTVVLILSLIRFFMDLAKWPIDQNYQASQGLNTYNDWWYSAFGILRPAEPGMALTACWIALMFSRKMRCEPSIIDRLGRIVAAYWIVAMVFSWISGQG